MQLSAKTLACLLPLALSLPAWGGIDLVAATNSYLVAKGETVTNEQWVYTMDAAVGGTLLDDLFLMAGNHAELDGAFKRDVWVLAGTVSLTGSADQNVRLSGRTIQINGPVGGNLVALGDTLHTSTNAAIQGDLKLYGNSVIVEGTTRGNVSVTASRLATISGKINGNLVVTAPEIILQPDARIGGDISYTSGKELVPADGVVGGELHRTAPPKAPVLTKERAVSHFMWFLAALLVGIPFIALFPMTTAMASQLLQASPWRCLWVGALCALALPVLGTMSLFSFLGIPLGLLVLGAWGFMAYTSRVIVALVLGTLLLRGQKAASFGGVLLAMTAGLALIYLGTLLPAIAWSVQTVVVSMGMGALLLSLFQKRQLMIQVPEELRKIKEMKNNQTEEKP